MTTEEVSQRLDRLEEQVQLLREAVAQAVLIGLRASTMAATADLDQRQRYVEEIERIFGEMKASLNDPIFIDK